MFETTTEGVPIRVDDLDRDWVLALAEDAEIAERRAVRSKLRLAMQWCVLHPGLDDTAVQIAGEGTPLVEEFTAEPLAAALGCSSATAQALMADVLDLAHRLPSIWRRTEALEVAPWRARRVAVATRGLSPAAAAHVDRELAGRIASAGPVAIDRAVAAAAAKYDAEVITAPEAQARRGVRISHGLPGRYDGTSWLEATADTPDLTAFHDLVGRVAAALAAHGDEDDLETRKAKALGVIADPEATRTLLEGAPPPAASKQELRFYVHLTPDQVTTDDGVVDIERLGAASIATIKDWAADHRVSIRPILDLAATDAVDAHDPPEWLRDLVVLRDRHCVFPSCQRDSRSCDLDHIVPYDPDGPPGQTHQHNLAPLCRRHHRAKTHSRWRYQRHHDGTYTWTSPQARTYLVTPIATHALT